MRDDGRGRELVDRLRRAGVSGADGGSLTRALYSADASLYRVVPAAVAFPRSADEVVAAHEVCRELGIPVTARGAGTSIAGNAVGPGLVLDLSRHLDRVLSVDAERREAVVQPGVVQARLQRSAAASGLRFGPDPSTHNRCTIGGMIGNNACGSRALGYGRTSDNVLALDVLTGAGDRLLLTSPAARGVGPSGAGTSGTGTPGIRTAPEVGPPGVPPSGAVADRLRDLVAGSLEPIRRGLGRFPRQVSGYALEHLLPEHGFDLARALVGSEGTLATVLRATVRLVADPPCRVLVVLGYADMAQAADAVPLVLPFGPTACEGLDARIVDAVRHRGPGTVPPLPRGAGWLFVELTGQTPAEVAAGAARLSRAAGAVDALVVEDPAHAAALWRIREDGAGLASRTPDGRPAHPGWEDAAVPPERLGAYLRDFDALLREHDLHGLPYGHFGDGCVHVRLDFPLERPDGPARLRDFLGDAAHLVARHGGSISGEHGDGRARSELLPILYPPQLLDLFARVKGLLDPDGLLNPGVLVDPRPVDADLRATGARPVREGLALAYRDDAGDFSAAVHRCNGVGRCRADTTGTGGVMCPSYLATREEKDSTRGRARVLQELARGALPDGWRSAEVHAALDLCLACKGCAADCPTGIDLAAYKAEVLYQAYRGRLRPRSHYSLGGLPRWARLAARAPRVVNAALDLPGLSRAGAWLAGVDRRRSLPRFAPRTFRQWFAQEQARDGRAASGADDRDDAPRSDAGTPVLLWVDTFTEHFAPEVGIAAVRVLRAAGYRVELPEPGLCCGLTWISTGRLDTARQVLDASVARLHPHVAAGRQVVGLEPSCTAVLRSDARELSRHPAAGQVAAGVVTLAELLTRTPGWTPPDLHGHPVVAQPHCHHAAVLDWSADDALLRRAGADLRRVAGCCGLAGNFGVERGHYEVSVAIAEHDLLPAVRSAPAGAVVLADGFSCRTQLTDLAGTTGLHLAQLLAEGLGPDGGAAPSADGGAVPDP